MTNRLKDLWRSLPVRREIDDLESHYVSSARHIVVGGCGRSGTTLARVILDSHPHICCGPESKIFLPRRIRPHKLRDRFKLDGAPFDAVYAASRSRAEFIDRFAALCCTTSGKQRWAEKTPDNVLNLGYIFSRFPETRFVHLLRDGRDVACSLRTHPRHKVVRGKLVKLNTWRPMEECVTRWRDSLAALKPYLADPRVHTVKYEDLVSEPRATVARMLEFLGEPWDERVLAHSQAESRYRDATTFPQNPEALKPIEAKSMRRWKRDMSAEDRAIFKQIAGSLLVETGYAVDDRW
jgi:hypothetical protein